MSGRESLIRDTAVESGIGLIPLDGCKRTFHAKHAHLLPGL